MPVFCLERPKVRTNTKGEALHYFKGGDVRIDVKKRAWVDNAQNLGQNLSRQVISDSTVFSHSHARASRMLSHPFTQESLQVWINFLKR